MQRKHVAEAPLPAICVQFRADPATPVELCHQNVCIAHARARGTADYADDAQ
jgi:hypothetical protein